VKTINTNYGYLIDGIGTQTHLSAGGGSLVQPALTALAGANVEVAITELDIKGASSSDYLAAVQACEKTALCISITSWGVSDANSWEASSSPLLWDRCAHPLPLVLFLKQY
jgi:endo-1,4-beta-xylanase